MGKKSKKFVLCDLCEEQCDLGDSEYGDCGVMLNEGGELAGIGIAPDKKVKCELCPKECELANLERGTCGVRYNAGGELRTLVYGKACALHIDPMEKKPMFHFLPGTPIFSVAAPGCNLSCKFCQNWQISQKNPEELINTDAPPQFIVDSALKEGCRSIAYTYTEPVIFYEYAYETAKLASENGLRNVMVTAGYINEKPLRELCRFIDGANVDIKAFDDRFYREICDGSLAPVLRALEVMNEEKVLIEITNLILPGLNDDMAKISKMSRWIAETLGEETPMHFSRFSPEYQMLNLPPTPTETLETAARVAKDAGLKHVYVGNMRSPEFETTYCPACGAVLIERSGFRIVSNNLQNGTCHKCGKSIHGVWS